MTHNSTAIEGNQLSRRDMEVILDEFAEGVGCMIGISEIDVPKNPRLEGFDNHDVAEVVNHAVAMEFIRENMFGKSLTIDKIVSVHKLLMGPSPSSSADMVSVDFNFATDFRTVPVRVKGSQTVRPYPQEVPAVMTKFLTRTEETFQLFHPVVAASLFFMNFNFIHPFADGNGRTSRLLLNMLLFNEGYSGCIFPVEQRDTYIALFDPYFEQHDSDPVFLFVAKHIQRLLQSLIFYNERGSIPEFDQ
jgi:Fic family protein